MVNSSNLSAAADAIRNGSLVAFPTETVYGLGANALNGDAVAAIFQLKERPRFDPLIVHVANVDQAVELVRSVPPLAHKLIEAFWPGPLSLVLSKRACVPDIVTSGLSSVALRCPGHDVARSLIDAAGVPIAAPSANRFGGVSPTTADHVREQFGDRLPIVLDDGPCRIGVESTVVSFVDSDDGHPILLRPGGVTSEEIQATIGSIEIKTNTPSSNTSPTSPGQLDRHYSPSTPLTLVPPDWTVDSSNAQLAKIGLLSFQTPRHIEGLAAVEVLSSEGDLSEAAVNLFAALRRLDALELDVIYATTVPEIQLGRAIMDRLRRAAAR